MSRKYRILIFLISALLLGGFILPQALAGDAPSLTGIWQGNLNVSGTELGIVIKLESDGSTYTGTLDVPMQGARGIPLSKIEFQDGQVRVEISSINAVYTGTLSADGQKLSGQWAQNGVTLPLDMELTQEEPTLNRPQEPKPPFPYKSEDVSYENKTAGITLAGTLTMPQGDGPFPAVILITGSGAQDRDESLMGHRPFLVLADYLTRRGLAVLRVDDRGVGGSTGTMQGATTLDFVGDVLSGVEYLKGRPEIDPGRIGLIGHSEGGLIAPLAAVQSQDVSFIVLMAGPGVNGDQIIQLQTELMLRAGGATEQAIDRELSLQRKCYDIIEQSTDDTQAAQELHDVLLAYVNGLSPQERQSIGDDVESFIQGRVQTLLDPWMRFFLTYDPAPTLQKVTCPVLAVGGDKDLQVPVGQNLPVIEAALKAGGNTDYTVKTLPGLNHLFQTCQTGSPSEYGQIEETISPDALQVIGDWIMAHVQ